MNLLNFVISVLKVVDSSVICDIWNSSIHMIVVRLFDRREIQPTNQPTQWRQRFVKNVLFLFCFFFKPCFLSITSKFHVVWTIRICSNFTCMWYKHFVRNVWGDFRLPVSALATVARKIFNDKVTAKIDFSIGHFMLPLPMLTLKVLSFSTHYLDHMIVKFEQNRMVRNIQNFELFDKKKNG